MIKFYCNQCAPGWRHGAGPADGLLHRLQPAGPVTLVHGSCLYNILRFARSDLICINRYFVKCGCGQLTAAAACTLLANSNNGRHQTPRGASSAQPRSRCNAAYRNRTGGTRVLHAMVASLAAYRNRMHACWFYVRTVRAQNTST